MEIILIFIGLMLIFTLSFKAGEYCSKPDSKFAAIGENFLLKKEKQLEESSFFGPLRKALAAGNNSKAFLVIFPLMLLKSAAFYFLGLFLITPLMLIIQGTMMGSIFRAYKKKFSSNELFVKVTYWQLSSHLIIGSLGFYVGLEWFSGGVFKHWSPDWLYSLWFYIVMSVIWAIVAAVLEVRMLVKDRYT